MLTAPKTRSESAIQNILSSIPNEVAVSFTEQQLVSLKVAMSSGEWETHKVDLRGTFPVPFFSSKIYYVFLMGRDYRNLTRQEQLISALTISLLVTLLIIFSVLMGILVLYLVKSALGINLIEGFSFGIWDWFKGLWK